MIRFTVVCLYILFFCYSTSFCQSNNRSVHKLYDYATKSFNEGWYKKSISLFTRLNEQYPFSTYESSVSLKIADAYFKLGQYLDAIEEYDYFEEMYPRDEFIPYVLYKKARAYLNQTYGLNNDQVFAKKALEYYSKLIERFPESEYTRMANVDIDTCYERLSGHEFTIGLFYYKNKNYNSAVSRFLKLVSTYPDNGYHYQALIHLSKCYHLIQEESLNNNRENK